MAHSTENKIVFKTPKLVTITPDRARSCMNQYYESIKSDPEKRNRPVNHARVAEYAADMLSGKWAINGETIKLDEDNIILDGQHRMLACIRANVPFSTYIITKVERSTFDTIDVGNIRTATQTLRVLGVRYSSNVSSIINGIRDFMVRMPDGCVYADKSRYRPHQAREVYNSNPEGFVEAAEFASRYTRTGVLSQKLLGTLYYYLVYVLKQDKELVSEFLINATFDDSVPNNLENNLRKKLFALKGLSFTFDRVRLSMIAKTWNALALGASQLKLPNCDKANALDTNPEVPQFEARS